MHAFTDGVFFWSGAVLWGWALAMLALLVTFGLSRRIHGRNPRRGGYMRHAASSGLSPAIKPTTLRTPLPGAFSSSSTAPGSQSEAAATLRRRLAQNKPGALTDCGCNEAGSPGAPPPAAGYDAEDMRVLLNDTALNQDDRSNQDWSRRA